MAHLAWLRYLRWMLATLFIVVALCGAFTILIDPLGIFGSPRIAGINAIKPYLDHHRDLARWRAARRLCPSAGIFGNSRAEIGFDPEHPGFRKQGLEAFNHAIPGTSINTAYRQLNWLQEANCAPKVIVLGVEFFDFLGASAGIPRLTPAPRIDAATLAETVFSLTAVRDSISTILLQNASNPATITPRGFNPLLNYVTEVERSGHYVLFRQRALENLKTWRRKALRLGPENGGPSSEYAGLEAFLAGAARSARTVHVVIYPYHAQIRLMLERAGLGELFAEWKASILHAARKFASEEVTIEVWDFSAVSHETLEEIPPHGDRKTHLRYYWEAGHFKKALGDRMLAQMLEHDVGFGMPLREDMLDAWMRADRQRVIAELANPSPLVNEVDSLTLVPDSR